ncbi:NADAR family protein [Lysinibacillus sp. CTST325]
MKETNEFVFFWGKQDVFSNFYYSPFNHQNQLFKWSEQAVMYRKAKLFGAEKIAQQIIRAQTPDECKKLGRSRQIPFDENIWSENREKIYYEVLLDKFSSPKLKSIILNTKDKTMVEASPYDKIWGIGMDCNNPNATNPSKWKGLNLLGKVLEKVREELNKRNQL